MAGKTISQDQLKEAVNAYCMAEGKQSSQSEEKPHKITIFQGTPEPGDPMLWLEDGHFKCSDTEFGMNFWENYLSAPEKALAPVGRQSIAPRKYGRDGAVNGSALDTVRRTAAARPKTYKASGQEEPYAVEKIKAFEEMGGSYLIVMSEVTRDSAKFRIRGTLPSGRYDEAEYTVFRDDWQLDMAWDMVDKQMEKFNNCILDLDNPALENRMPNLLPGAKMKVRKGDEVGSKIVEVPAAYHIATTVNKLWKFQPIQVQTKAKAKIAKELAGADDMLEMGEITEEERERGQIAEVSA